MEKQNLLQEIYNKLNTPSKRMFRDEVVSSGYISYPHFYALLSGKCEINKLLKEKIIEIVYNHFKEIDLNIYVGPFKNKKAEIIKRFNELMENNHNASFIFMSLTLEFNLNNANELYKFLEGNPKFKELVAIEVNN